ncbi:hypothetical protein V1525DRAFT_198231 [Lipomyces kononenkoae]|uniref:Uncharacterized protein n=1 Tax=Lipomyces kononenkoae TaxID=34357 RepID=A0ACC3SYN3_LIPKO
MAGDVIAKSMQQPGSTISTKQAIHVAIQEAHQRATGRYYKRTALDGLGGVRKSKIAIEWAYRVRESAPGTWVFWIHASNAARFEQGYHELASMGLNVPPRYPANSFLSEPLALKPS